MKTEKQKFKIGDLIKHEPMPIEASDWRRVRGLGVVCSLPSRAQPWYLVHLSDGRRLHFDEDEMKKVSK